MGYSWIPSVVEFTKGYLDWKDHEEGIDVHNRDGRFFA